ncbi:MAG: hypothetical protein IJ157_13385 [Clostridia bacterium]|nr:hypothetical protein [Clostridia bacterium]
MKKICLCLALCLLLVSARADEIFGGASSYGEVSYMADDGTRIFHSVDSGGLKIMSAQGDQEIALPPEYNDIWRMDYTDPLNFTMVCRTDEHYSVLPVQDGALQPAVPLPDNACVLHRPLGEHIYYHTANDSRLCRFNWKTGEEETLVPRVGGLYHADRWHDTDYLIFTLPTKKGEYNGRFFLMTADGAGRCSTPIPLPEGMDFAASPLCATHRGGVLIAGTPRSEALYNNASTLYCYDETGKLLWQTSAECHAYRLIPTQEGYTVVGHRGGPVVRREININGEPVAEQVYKSFVPGSEFPVVDGAVYYWPFSDDDPFFIPLE